MNYDEALYKSAAYCSQAERCIAELQAKFEQWDVVLSDRKKIISYLKQEKYLDESRYAQSFVKDKFRYNKWGKIKISYVLRGKNISAEIIREAMESIEHEDYIEMIRKLAKEKQKSLKFSNEYERQGKLLRYLAGKGFEPGIIQKVLK